MINEGRGFDAALYRLLAWFSPMFPIGAFSYSHGLEAAAARDKVHDCDSLQCSIAAVLAYGTGRIDADILRDAHRAALAADLEALETANRRGLAFRATAEMALETAAQGAAFLAACRAAWSDPRFDARAAILDDGPVCCAAAVGGATAWAGIPLSCALAAYLQAMAANLVSAGHDHIRL
jgi:urease accessory protein